MFICFMEIYLFLLQPLKTSYVTFRKRYCISYEGLFSPQTADLKFSTTFPCKAIIITISIIRFCLKAKIISTVKEMYTIQNLCSNFCPSWCHKSPSWLVDEKQNVLPFMFSSLVNKSIMLLPPDLHIKLGLSTSGMCRNYWFSWYLPMDYQSLSFCFLKLCNDLGLIWKRCFKMYGSRKQLFFQDSLKQLLIVVRRLLLKLCNMETQLL